MPPRHALLAVSLLTIACTTEPPAEERTLAAAEAQPSPSPPAEAPAPELAWQKLADGALARAERPGAISVFDIRRDEFVAAAARPGRAVKSSSSPLSPGSTVKPIIVLAAVHEGLVTPDETIDCAGPREIGGETFTCFHDHGPLALAPALATSCNHYTFELATRLGYGPIVDRFEAFGFLTKIGEVHPLAASREVWAPSAATGHGGLSVSPRQLARAYAALATGTQPIPDRREWSYTEAELDIVRAALIGVVADPRGTGRRAAVEGLTIAGKTGTTETVVGDEQIGLAWFAGWAPAEDPRISVVVVLEGEGSGGEIAAPVAAELFEALIRPPS